METIYLCIVVFLLCLAVFDLFVGVSNDAVNFLNSAIGAKVAKFRTVMIVASAGVALGAVMSSGMMDVARHGIMQPSNFTFYDVMTIFLAVMVTDVIVLDMFNTLGMPTSTTVSLVFELLGGTFVIAALKIATDPSLQFGDLLNTDKALSVIVAIFVSVAIAFVFGCIVQWISRVVFTFNYKKHSRYSIALFGGIAFTSLAYFIFLKGICKSHYLDDSIRDWVQANTSMLLVYTFIGSSIVMQIFHLLRINVFKFVVLMGTFGMSFSLDNSFATLRNILGRSFSNPSNILLNSLIANLAVKLCVRATCFESKSHTISGSCVLIMRRNTLLLSASFSFLVYWRLLRMRRKITKPMKRILATIPP
jgi:phosphate/sulfate permease